MQPGLANCLNMLSIFSHTQSAHYVLYFYCLITCSHFCSLCSCAFFCTFDNSLHYHFIIIITTTYFFIIISYVHVLLWLFCHLTYYFIYLMHNLSRLALHFTKLHQVYNCVCDKYTNLRFHLCI